MKNYASGQLSEVTKTVGTMKDYVVSQLSVKTSTSTYKTMEAV